MELSNSTLENTIDKSSMEESASNHKNSIENSNHNKMNDHLNSKLIPLTTYSKKGSNMKKLDISFMLDSDVDDEGESDENGFLFNSEESINDKTLSSSSSPSPHCSLFDTSGMTETEIESPIYKSNVSGDKLEIAIRSLMGEESLSWSMKQWYSEIEKITGIDICSNSDIKILIKSLMFNEGEVFMSQTQTQPDNTFQLHDKEDNVDLVLYKSNEINDIFEDDNSEDEEFYSQNVITKKIKSKKSRQKPNNEIDDDNDEMDSEDSDDLNKKRATNPKITKKKKTGINHLAEQSEAIVNQEVEAVKQLERGPSEADIRRMEATEIDPDEVEERARKREVMASKLLSAISGISLLEKKQKMKESHSWLREKYSNDKLKIIITDDISKCISRLYKIAKNDDVVYQRNIILEFLLEEFPEENDENVQNNINHKNLEQPMDIEVIYLTDSESEEEAINHRNNLIVNTNPTTNINHVTMSNLSKPLASGKDHRDLMPDRNKLKQDFERRRKELLLQKTNSLHYMNPLSDRCSLLSALNKRVQQKAIENHCKIEKTKKYGIFDIKERNEISYHCRRLVELFKMKEERDVILEAKQSKRDRARYKNKYITTKNESDGEFDDNYDPTFGKEISEEEQLEIIRRAQEQEEEEQEEEEQELSEPDEDNMELPKAIDDEAEEEGSVVSNDSSLERKDTITTTKILESTETNNHIPSLSSVSSDHEPLVMKINPVLRTYSRRSRIVQDDENDDPNHSQIKLIGIQEDDKKTLDDNKDNDSQEKEEDMNDSDEDGNSDDKEENDDESNDDLDINIDREENKPKKPKIKNTLYRMQLIEEERRHRVEKSRQSSLLELEAEEEEEEGAQAGLGDFGFSYKKNDMDDEADALKLREGDLDHIVDDIDDDEGDEEAGLRARLAMQEREEKQQTKAIITAITEGHDAAKRLFTNKSALSFHDLIDDDGEIRRRKMLSESQKLQGKEGEGKEEELDEEEMLMRGFQIRKERDQNIIRDELDDSEDEDEDEEDISQENEIDEEEFAKMTEEEKAKEIQWIQKRRESYKIAMLKRKQFEEYTRMRRALRRAQSTVGNNMDLQLSSNLQASILLQPAVSLSLDPLSHHTPTLYNDNQLNTQETNEGKNSLKKRRTSLIPKKFEGKPTRIALSTTQRSYSTNGSSTSNSNINSNTSSNTNSNINTNSNLTAPIKRSTSAYKGTIDKAELIGGYGMGMAVTAVNARRTLSISALNGTGQGLGQGLEQGLGLFSTVTGIVNAQTSTYGTGNKLKRSFSAISRNRLQSTTGVTIAAKHFVFMGEDTNSQSIGIPTLSSSITTTTNVTNPSHGSSSLHRMSGSSNSSIMNRNINGTSSTLFDRLNARSHNLKKSFKTDKNSI